MVLSVNLNALCMVVLRIRRRACCELKQLKETRRYAIDLLLIDFSSLGCGAGRPLLEGSCKLSRADRSVRDKACREHCSSLGAGIAAGTSAHRVEFARFGFDQEPISQRSKVDASKDRSSDSLR